MTTTDQARRKRALERLRDPERNPVFWGTFDRLEDLERSLIGNAPTIGDSATITHEGGRSFVFTDEGWLSLSGVNGV